MRLPYLQVSQEFLTAQAPEISVRARCDLPTVIGAGILLFRHAVERTATEDSPPTGVFDEPDAAEVLEGIMRWNGEPGQLLGAFAKAGVVEFLAVGVRVRGLDRYAKAWEGAHKARERKAKWLKEREDVGGTRSERVPNAFGTPPNADADAEEKKKRSARASRPRPRRTAEDQQPAADPRHAPLVKRLCDVYERLKHKRYPFDGRAARVVQQLLGLADSPDDVVAAWEAAVQHRGFPSVATLPELAQHLPRFLPAKPQRAPERVQLGTVWGAALAEIKAQGKEYALEWLQLMRQVECTPTQITLEAPDQYKRTWLLDHYRGLLETVLAGRRLLVVIAPAKGPEPPQLALVGGGEPMANLGR